ncbi:hypothetical protein CXF72_16615 [Psychromonas sp. MB-3u-54]|uniref:hypothetical protein n=1 Tax=Psychromonas sp. MB-3u-54 TaxID=2058319 RepID=UPI000C33382D|nr:hypothetical protein [Psychromonas sp. MB-3u-54]PKH01472.1 hypothetical protein CXF72_16615 [Psychromonas sp. MB-3u-54]
MDLVLLIANKTTRLAFIVNRESNQISARIAIICGHLLLRRQKVSYFLYRFNNNSFNPLPLTGVSDNNDRIYLLLK